VARMSIDDKALRDPRVLRLAKRLGWSRRETLGALLDVWAVCYDRVASVLEVEDVDAAAELEGFAEHMGHVGLADLVPEGAEIRGAHKRIRYLANQAERGRAGGRKRVLNTIAASIRDAEYTSQALASSTAQANPKLPDTVPDSASAPDAVPERKKMSAKPTLQALSSEEAAAVREVLSRLTTRSGVTYRGSKAHAALIVARLRDGITVWDLRRVIGYCAEALGWEDKPEMRRYLRPETLFGPQTIEKYLDAARAWAPGDAPTEQTTNARQLRLVKPEEASNA
jgi:uncharacterized phage protein (TIGR02220 family)